MQLIRNGPDIPERLLEAHEEGRVVFFCGAGISCPADLPGFSGLVQSLYVKLGTTPTPVEAAAVDRSQFDTAIGLIEGRIVGGRTAVREQVAEILRPNLARPHATATHEALLALSKTRDGRSRLITTNFDRLFQEVTQRDALELKTYEAPLLPVPKHRWDGLVYLHGLLSPKPTPSDLDRLVLSSGDFGLAYLTERWAARFVSELFRSYTVCFVGYSINDPVLRYMMDALAADRLLGEAPPEVFAFGSCSRGHEAEAASEWQSKNVTPILYRNYRHHFYLHQTLRAWSRLYRDGVLGKEQIVVRHAFARPLTSTQQDDFVGRMLWSLGDLSGLPAKRFAKLDPVPSLDWLSPMSDQRYGHGDLSRFGVQPNLAKDENLNFSLIARPTPYALAPWVVVSAGAYNKGLWDNVMYWLARWLLRHLDEAQLILWVASRGGQLHPRFRTLLETALIGNPPSRLMQTLWRLVLAGYLEDQSRQLDIYDWRKSFAREGLTFALRMELRKLLAPRVQLTPPFFSSDQGAPAARPPEKISDLVRWEIVLVGTHVHTAMRDITGDERWRTALPELLQDATQLLRDALDLMRELGGAEERSDHTYVTNPSIAEHSQNTRYYDWTFLIELTRDAWLATVDASPDKARQEVQCWLTIRYPIFRRLVFFAAAETELFPTADAIDWLLDEGNWWLWSVETEREAISLLKALAQRLSPEESDRLQNAIIEGPPAAMFRDDIEPDRLRRISDREKWLRLAKLSQAGAALDADANAALDALTAEYPDWQVAPDERDEFPFWMGEADESRTFLPTPKDTRQLALWLREHPAAGDWQEDDWQERCRADFPRAATALLRLAAEEDWVVGRWRQALQAWSDERLAARSWRYLAETLASAPDEIVRQLAHPLGWWLQKVSKVFTVGEDQFFSLIQDILEQSKADRLDPDADLPIVSINHPVGYATDAALGWWFRQGLKDGQGLRTEIGPILTALCDSEIPIFRYGRFVLATHVIALFRVDQPWTEASLLPFFDWEVSPEEAVAAWKGFLLSPRLYPPLLRALRTPFLSTAEHYDELGEYGTQYADLLTFAALEPRDVFSRQELAVATEKLPAQGLESAAQTLARILEGSGEQRVEYWHNRVVPYLRHVWPKSRERLTPSISESFGRLCVAADHAFPNAFETLRPWLQSIAHAGFVVRLLEEAKLCERFPAEALAFLDIVVGDTDWPPSELAACLTAIEQADPGLRDDNRFQRLRQLQRGHE